ncbi:hypothetical protein [Nocardioides yefusunii]|uniref:Uncharacterized protein n=1 Tax=Nocardioides yefusunii TaxID=2500546 RepID=A0ABW1QX73_9ACTN|nr:hypothetical protein [Nocardioides yefusunii]
MTAQPESQFLLDATVTELRFDGRRPFVVCGLDVLARDGQGALLLVEADANAEIVDVEPVQEWLRGRAALDLNAALELWNMAVDVARTLDLPFRQRGRTADVCYGKLFAAVLPRFAYSGPGEYDGSGYTPIWTPAQYRTLRRVMGDALHVLRVGVPAPASR